MPIEITISKAPRSANYNKPSHVFTELGGTIGRGADNTWVLDDPNRYMSSRHAEIRYDSGQYYLVDISTNGTFHNGSNEPLGSGNRIALKDGDRFALSDYEFLVTIREGAATFANLHDPYGASPFDSASALPFPQGAGSPLSHDDPFAAPLDRPVHVAATPFGPIHEETDPLAALDRANCYGSSASPSSFEFRSTQGDSADPLSQAVSWPSAIPEDWDRDDYAPAEASASLSRPIPIQPKPAEAMGGSAELLDRLIHSEQARKVLEEENKRLLAELASLRQQSKTPQGPQAQSAAVRALSSLDKELIAAMGLDVNSMSEQKMLEITRMSGELIREAVAGLMQVLSFRKRIKEEFRINVTTIQPVENNPLKFSANLEDALENMFLKDNRAYQKPIEAVRESFQGIAEHQVAVLAGIQAAFRGMIDRLDPEALEKRFEKYRGGVLKVGQKGKNWDAYKEFHQDLVNNMDNSFQHLFGYDFVQAYENQMQKLMISRKAARKDKGNSL